MNVFRILKLVSAVALVAGIAGAFALRDRLDLALLTNLVGDLGIWAGVVFVALFAAGAVLFLPGAAFGLAGGALFGPLWGTVLNVVGGSIGATFAFLIARYLAADWVARRAGGRLKAIVDGVEAEGWRFVALVRLVPLFPFNLTNYALGLTRIPLSHYVTATVVCVIPGSAAFAWLGHAGRSAVGSEQSALQYGLLGLGALAAIALLPRLIARFRRRFQATVAWIEARDLAKATQVGGDRAIVDVRGSDEFRGPLGHIPGALNVPVDSIAADPHQLDRFKDRVLILVCRTDRRSARAAEVLKSAGLQHTAVLRGGMERWKELGLPISFDGADP